MATLKQRLHKKNSSGGYDIVHLETSASLVKMADGTTAEDAINGKAASSHNHAASNITSGTLPVARGGTGITSNPSVLVNLGSTSAASVFAASPRPGVTGTLPVARGGTGVTSLSALATAIGASTIKYGSYTGNMPLSTTNTTVSQTINLGATPKAVLLIVFGTSFINTEGSPYARYSDVLIVYAGRAVVGNACTLAEIVTNGFKVSSYYKPSVYSDDGSTHYGYHDKANTANITYDYIAFM